MNIPNNFITQCPMLEGQLVRAATKCGQCEHFKGLTEISADETAAFHKRYRIICGFPRVQKGWLLDD